MYVYVWQYMFLVYNVPNLSEHSNEGKNVFVRPCNDGIFNIDMLSLFFKIYIIILKFLK